MRGEFRARVMKEGKTYYGIARATPLEASKDAEELRQRLYGQFATQH
jgi:hypothetical protein